MSNQYASLDELPAGSIVGTSSLRRESQLRAKYPHLVIQPLRGNLGTRLKKLDDGQYAAIILAVAGLKRLGLGERIRGILSTEQSLPAVGQGAVGIECREDQPDIIHLLQQLAHPETSLRVIAERAMSRTLGGSCQVPLGGFAELEGNHLRLRGFVAEPDGSRILTAERHLQLGAHPEEEANQLGIQIAEDLARQGADAIMAKLA